MRLYDFLKNIILIVFLLHVTPPLIRSFIHNYQEPKTRVALVPIKGVLYDATETNMLLHTYFKDSTIKAIVLKIESPGTATGTGQSIHNEIMHLKSTYQKPIVSLVENTCASGAYLIASATDYIVAPGMAVIGSIGVSLSYLFQLRSFIEKYAISYVPLTAGSYKSTGDPFVNLTDDQKALLQAMLNDSYEQFTTLIAHNRRLSINTIPTWADGKIFTGKQALTLGLIDALGSTSTLVAVIKEKALIEGNIEWVKKEKPLNFLTTLLWGERSSSDGSLIEGIAQAIVSLIESKCATVRT